MKRFKILILALSSIIALCANNGVYSQTPLSAREYIKLTEFKLENGLHVIINRDTTSPIVTIGTMYHVGGKNEDSGKTGFAHLCEHLMFHGTKNISEGNFEKIIREAGGYSNASTTSDRTYYYLIMPANQLETALWLEAERMLAPTISQSGLLREIEVVKEELRVRYKRGALSNSENIMMDFVFTEHPYKQPLIGYEEHLNSVTTDYFYNFTRKWYTPDNATLVVSGDVEIDEIKEMVYKYFAHIPKGEIKRERPIFNPQTQIIGRSQTVKIAGLESPHLILSYFAVPEGERDADILKFVINLMTEEGVGELRQLQNDTTQGIKKITASPEFYEDAGMVWFRVSFNKEEEMGKVKAKIEELLKKYSTTGVEKSRIERLKKSYLSDFIDLYFSPSVIAEFAAWSYLLKGDPYYNIELVERINSITNEEIKRVVNTYLIEDRLNYLLFTK